MLENLKLRAKVTHSIRNYFWWVGVYWWKQLILSKSGQSPEAGARLFGTIRVTEAPPSPQSPLVLSSSWWMLDRFDCYYQIVKMLPWWRLREFVSLEFTQVDLPGLASKETKISQKLPRLRAWWNSFLVWRHRWRDGLFLTVLIQIRVLDIQASGLWSGVDFLKSSEDSASLLRGQSEQQITTTEA